MSTEAKENNSLSIDFNQRLKEVIALGEGGIGLLERIQKMHSDEVDKKNKEEFYRDFVRAKQQIPSIPKNRSGHGYKYADLPSIKKTIDPVLAKNNISYNFSYEEDQKRLVCICNIFHANGHSEKTRHYINKSESRLSRDGKKTMSNAQVSGGDMTYSTRYALASAFALTIEDDNDASPVVATQPQPQPTLTNRDVLLKKIGDLIIRLDIPINTLLADYIKKYEPNISDPRNITEATCLKVLEELHFKEAGIQQSKDLSKEMA